MADTPDPRERFTQADPRRNFRAPAAGGTSGGAISATPQTQWGVGDTSSALARLMDPYVKQRQQEGFVKGYIEQAKATAEVAVVDDTNPVSKLFGPSHYEQGASAFTAGSKVMQWKTAALQDMDNLKQLSDSDFQKWIGTEMENFNTGNRWADELMAGQAMKEIPGIVQVRTEARYALQQQQASTAYRGLVESAAGAYGAYRGTRLSQPGIYEETETDRLEDRNFLGVISQKAPGQSDEAYQRDLTQSLMLQVDNGNPHGYNLAKKAGLLNFLDDKTRKAMEDGYESNAKKGMADTALNSKDIRERLATLTIRQQRAADPFWQASAEEPRKISPNEAQEEMMSINDEVARRSGYEGVPLFGLERVLSEGDTVIKGMASAARAANDRAATRADNIAEKQLEKEMEAKVAVLAWGNGDSREAELGGTPSGTFDVLAADSVVKGDIGTIAKNYTKNPKVYESAKRTIMAPIEAAKGVGYTNALDQSLITFNNMRATNLSMAMAYYGPEYARLEQVDRSIKGKQLPEQAWNQVYKQDFLGEQRTWARPQQRKDTEKGVKEWGEQHLNGSMIGRLGISDNKALNASGQTAFMSQATRQLAIYQDSTLALDDQVAAVYDTVVANGSFQHYGRFGWEAPVGTPKLHDVIGFPKETVAPVLEAVLAGGLSRRNPKAGKRMDSMEFISAPVGNRGEIKLTVFETLDDGTEVFMDIDSKQLREASAAFVKAQAEQKDAVNFVIRGKPGADPGQVFKDNMKRTIGGEEHETYAPPPNATEAGKKFLRGLAAVKG